LQWTAKRSGHYIFNKKNCVNLNAFLFYDGGLLKMDEQPDRNTLRTGAFKLFKCTFQGSKQF